MGSFFVPSHNPHPLMSAGQWMVQSGGCLVANPVAANKTVPGILLAQWGARVCLEGGSAKLLEKWIARKVAGLVENRGAQKIGSTVELMLLGWSAGFCSSPLIVRPRSLARCASSNRARGSIIRSSASPRISSGLIVTVFSANEMARCKSQRSSSKPSPAGAQVGKAQKIPIAAFKPRRQDRN